jgi:hypothetical protein
VIKLKETLRPSWLGFLYLLVCLASWTIVSSSMSGSMVLDQPHLARESVSFAAGAVTVVRVGDASHVQFNWPVLFLMLLTSYLLSATLARWVIVSSSFKRPQVAHTSAVFILLLLSCLAGILASKKMWGYYFSRPGPPALLGELRRVSKVSFVETPDSKPRQFVLSSDSASRSSQFGMQPSDPYYYLQGRILGKLHEQGLRPGSAQHRIGELDQYRQAIQDAGILVPGDRGYDAADRLSGILVDGETADGSKLVILGLRSGQVSDDHYAYYELVFRDTGSPQGLVLASSQHFFYDVAGMEGLEWWGLSMLFGFPIVGLGYLGFVGYDLFARQKLDRSLQRLRVRRVG